MDQSTPNFQPKLAVAIPFWKTPLFFITLSVLVLIAVVASLFYFDKLPYLKKGGYKLQCGQETLKNCTYSELKTGDKVYIRVDVSNAFLKYREQRPDLCYYTNIEPQDNLVPFQKINIENQQFFGGCIQNAYSFYKQRGLFAFFISGVLKDDNLIIRAFLIPSTQSSIEDKITKEGIQVFKLK